MATLVDFRAKQDSTVKEAPPAFAQADKDRFIAEAVRQYSRDVPREIVAELTGTGTAQTFAVPAGWTVGLSVIREVEFPIDEVPRVLIDPQEHVEVWRNTAGADKINTRDFTLASGEKARILFSAQHVVDLTASSVPDNDFDAVCNLASAKLARAVAIFHGEAIDSTLPAELVDHQAKAVIFDALATSLEKQYREHVETGDVVVGDIRHHDLDIRLRTGGDLLWNPSRIR